jgi:PAS domain S-box-containing protein
MVSEFEKGLQTQREASLGASVQDAATLHEELLNAYEELRTQYEELAAVRLELESAAARNERLFGGATVAYLITDRKGIILDANRAAWQLFGHSAPPPPRLPVATQFPPGSRRTVRALISRATVAGEPQTVRSASADTTETSSCGSTSSCAANRGRVPRC